MGVMRYPLLSTLTEHLATVSSDNSACFMLSGHPVLAVVRRDDEIIIHINVTIGIYPITKGTKCCNLPLS